jgi:hypothetical protein
VYVVLHKHDLTQVADRTRTRCSQDGSGVQDAFHAVAKAALERKLSARAEGRSSAAGTGFTVTAGSVPVKGGWLRSSLLGRTCC